MSDGKLLNDALSRLQVLLGHPGGDTVGMLAKACEEIEAMREVCEAAKATGKFLALEEGKINMLAMSAVLAGLLERQQGAARRFAAVREGNRDYNAAREALAAEMQRMGIISGQRDEYRTLLVAAREDADRLATALLAAHHDEELVAVYAPECDLPYALCRSCGASYMANSWGVPADEMRAAVVHESHCFLVLRRAALAAHEALLSGRPAPDYKAEAMAARPLLTDAGWPEPGSMMLDRSVYAKHRAANSAAKGAGE